MEKADYESNTNSGRCVWLVIETINMHFNIIAMKSDAARSYLSDMVEKGSYNRSLTLFEQIYKTLNFDLDRLIMIEIGICFREEKSSPYMNLHFSEDTNKIIEILECLKKIPLVERTRSLCNPGSINNQWQGINFPNPFYFQVISVIMKMVKLIPKTQTRLKRRKI